MSESDHQNTCILSSWLLSSYATCNMHSPWFVRGTTPLQRRKSLLPSKSTAPHAGHSKNIYTFTSSPMLPIPLSWDPYCMCFSTNNRFCRKTWVRRVSFVEKSLVVLLWVLLRLHEILGLCLSALVLGRGGCHNLLSSSLTCCSLCWVRAVLGLGPNSDTGQPPIAPTKTPGLVVNCCAARRP